MVKGKVMDKSSNQQSKHQEKKQEFVKNVDNLKKAINNFRLKVNKFHWNKSA